MYEPDGTKTLVYANETLISSIVQSAYGIQVDEK